MVPFVMSKPSSGVGHRPDALFILDTVSEIGRFGAFGGLF